MATKKKFMIVGNWKMNPDTLEDARSLFAALCRKAKGSQADVVVAPPAPFIAPLAAKKQDAAALGVQDVAAEPRGAYTGSFSAAQARSAGARYAIIGHSERRMAGDTDEIVLRKAQLALEAGLEVILCVGERERDENARYLGFIRDQIASVLGAVDKKRASSITIAYEPVWAIGKSFDLAPKPRDVHEMSLFVRKTAAEILGKKDGLRMPVLYGGAVSADNAKAFLEEGEVEGLLVGRQSLDAEAFGTIISHAK